MKVQGKEPCRSGPLKEALTRRDTHAAPAHPRSPGTLAGGQQRRLVPTVCERQDLNERQGRRWERVLLLSLPCPTYALLPRGDLRLLNTQLWTRWCFSRGRATGSTEEGASP